MNAGSWRHQMLCDHPSARFDGCRNGGLQSKASLGHKWESVSNRQTVLHEDSPIVHLVMHAAIVADQTGCISDAVVLGPPVVIGL